MTIRKPTRIYYNIEKPSEETNCDYCGCPLLIGDGAVEQDGKVFCSRFCAEEDQEPVCLYCGEPGHPGSLCENCNREIPK